MAFRYLKFGFPDSAYQTHLKLFIVCNKLVMAKFLFSYEADIPLATLDACLPWYKHRIICRDLKILRSQGFSEIKQVYLLKSQVEIYKESILIQNIGYLLSNKGSTVIISNRKSHFFAKNIRDLKTFTVISEYQDFTY